MRWLVAFLLVVSVASAAPIVEIRARTQLTLTRARVIADDTVEVTGALVDKLTGAGIANQRVTVSVGGVTHTPFTGPDGGFTEGFPYTGGPVSIALDFPGGDRVDRAQPLTVTTDPTKAELELTLVKLSDDPTGAKIRVDARTDEPVTGLPVELAVAPVGGDTFRVLRQVQSGSEQLFTRAEAGGPGLYRLRARFAGSDRMQAATAIVTIEMASGSVTTMKLSSTNVAYEDDLDVAGTVTDEDGKPLARAAVTLMSGDRRLAQTTTDSHGAYHFDIEAQVIGQGQMGVQVSADPGVIFIRGSRSTPQVVKIAAPQPVPVSWTIAGFLATVAAAGGFFAARSKPWQKLRRANKPAEESGAEDSEVDVATGGLVTAKPGVVATLRRAHDDGISGVVRDTVRGRPIADAVIVLAIGDRERSIRTTADGSFALETLEPGEWRADVSAPGHVSERFAVSIPHRGELRGVRVDLVPVRERVFQLYRRAAEPILPEPRLWGIWSPRQIVDHVRAKRPSPALAELTDFVEEVYFSPRLAEEAVLAQAEGRVTRALDERARPR